MGNWNVAQHLAVRIENAPSLHEVLGLTTSLKKDILDQLSKSY